MKLNDDTYRIDLSIDFDIISTFNIDCLVDYKSLDVTKHGNDSTDDF